MVGGSPSPAGVAGAEGLSDALEAAAVVVAVAVAAAAAAAVDHLELHGGWETVGGVSGVWSAGKLYSEQRRWRMKKRSWSL